MASSFLSLLATRPFASNWTMVVASLLVCFGTPLVADADLIELLSGGKLEGQVTKIDKEAREVTIATVMGGRHYTRVYSYDRIHAVTLGERRYVLNEMPELGTEPPRLKPAIGTSAASKPPATTDVAKLIEPDESPPSRRLTYVPIGGPRPVVVARGGCRLAIPDRRTVSGEAFAAESAIQQALLFHGGFYSPEYISEAGKPSGVVFGMDDVRTALKTLGVSVSPHVGAMTLNKFIELVCKEVRGGYPVLVGMKANPTKNPNQDVDRFALISGFDQDSLAVNTTWGQIQNISFVELASTDHHLSFKHNRDWYFALAIKGFADAEPEEARVSLYVPANSDVRSERVKLTIACDGLRKGTIYEITHQRGEGRTVENLSMARFVAGQELAVWEDELPPNANRGTWYRYRCRPIKKASKAEVAKALALLTARRIPRAEFEDFPMSGVVDYLASVSELDISTDWEAMDQLFHIDQQSPVTVMRTNTTARVVLELALLQTGEHGAMINKVAPSLEAMIEQGIFTIRPKTAAPRRGQVSRPADHGQ